MTNGRSPRSGTEPPRSHRFGQPDANPTGDQRTAALAHATKRHATEILAEALDADEDGFNAIVDDPKTPFVVRQLLNAFRGDGQLSAMGVKTLLAIWQQVFGSPTQTVKNETTLNVLNPDMVQAFSPDEITYIAASKYPSDDGEILPGYVIDPRNGNPLMVLEDPHDRERGRFVTVHVGGRPEHDG
jgi:hypothetical protein